MLFTRRIIQEHYQQANGSVKKLKQPYPALYCWNDTRGERKKNEKFAKKRQVSSSRTHLQPVFFAHTPYSKDVLVQNIARTYIHIHTIHTHKQQRTMNRKKLQKKTHRNNDSSEQQSQRTEQKSIGEKKAK